MTTTMVRTTGSDHHRIQPRRRARLRSSRPITVIPHVALMHYETAQQHTDGTLTWTDRGCRVARVAIADQATADFLPYSQTAADLVAGPDGIDYTDVAACRVSVAVTNEAGAIFTSYALFYPELSRNEPGNDTSA